MLNESELNTQLLNEVTAGDEAHALVDAVATGTLSNDFDLAAVASAVVSASGLEGVTPLYSDAVSQAIAEGDLTTYTFSGDVTVQITATGNMERISVLEGNAENKATGNADLSPYNIYADASVVLNSVASLTSKSALLSSAISEAGVSGNLDALLALSASVNSVIAATASLNNMVNISGDGFSSALSDGEISIQSLLSSTAGLVSLASGQLGAVSSLSSDALNQITTTGALSQDMVMLAVAGSISVAQATVSQFTTLMAAAQAAVDVEGALTTVPVVVPGVTYVINTETGAVTTWNSVSFTKMAQAYGVLYGLSNGTLYTVGGDTDPDDNLINSVVRFAPSNFGTFFTKRLEALFFMSRETTGIKVTPIYDEIEGREYYSIPVNMDGLRATRVPVGKGTKWNTLGFIIENISGGKLDIGGIDPVIYALNRRGR